MKNGLIVDKNGIKRYYMNNKIHRVDGAAEEWANGSTRWFLNGKRHRVDGPAEEWSNGDKVWYLHDKKHREDGPAEEWSNGLKRWYVNGEPLVHPKEFKNMEAWFDKVNTDEEYSLQCINEFKWIITFIKNPTSKQKRLHAMKWKI